MARQKTSISGLLLAVSFLALMSLSPVGTVLGDAASPESFSHSHSWHSWNPSYTYSHWSGSWTGFRTWTGWSMSVTGSFTFTRSRHSHPFPIYTTTQYFPAPTIFCDPNNPYSPCYSPTPCNPYDPYSPCYVPPPEVTYYPTQTAIIQSTVQTVLTVATIQTVPPPGQGPGFSVVAYPSIISLPPGNFAGSIEFTLNLTSIQGWTGTVDFTASSLPPGITFSNFPSQFTLSSPIASWDVEANVAPSTQPGSYSILIVASSGTVAQSTSLTIEVP